MSVCCILAKCPGSIKLFWFPEYSAQTAIKNCVMSMLKKAEEASWQNKSTRAAPWKLGCQALTVWLLMCFQFKLRKKHLKTPKEHNCSIDLTVMWHPEELHGLQSVIFGYKCTKQNYLNFFPVTCLFVLCNYWERKKIGNCKVLHIHVNDQ